VISIFKKNDVLNILLLLPYAILLRIYSLARPQAYVPTEADSVLSTWIFNAIPYPLLQSIIAILLVFGQAITINVLINNHRLYKYPNTLAGMIYILLVSCIPQLQVLSPALIGATFIIISTFHLFNTYKLNAATTQIFNAALTACLAAFIYPPYALLIIAIFIGLSTMRNFSLIERLQFLIGYVSIVWIITALYFYLNQLSTDVFRFLNFPGVFKNFSYQLSAENISALGYVLLVVISLLNYYNYVKKKGIDARKKISFFYWVMVCALCAIFFYAGLDLQHFIYIAIPLAFFLSMSILLVKYVFVLEVIHLCLLVGILYFHFYGIHGL